MMNNLIIKAVISFLLPVILLLALYVQIHGDYTPGGGFQAGAIAASIMIIYSMITGNFIPTWNVRIISSVGVVIYIGTGLISIVRSGNFLNYSVLLRNEVAGQGLGVILVEAGVGITVFSSMLLIYNSLNTK